MQYITDYFDIKELVCPHVFEKHGEQAWGFFDPRLLADLLYVRHNIARPVWVNSWAVGGQYSQRGFRCNLCAIVNNNTKRDKLYISAHSQGMAVDFDVKGMTAEAVRKWIKDNAACLPYPCRLEDGVGWVHLDVRNDGSRGKVITFKA